MKNYIAQAGATLTLANGPDSTTVDLYSRDGLDMLSNLWIKAAAEHRLMYEVAWLGRPVIQFPTDIVVMQELLWDLKPDVVIETGVAHGGSLILSASILELIGKGTVIGIDVEVRPHNRAAIKAHPMSKRIKLIEGSSTADETFAKVRQTAAGAETVVVFLDSNHTEAHVLKELEM
jgi:cephalosporin hydroxylase